VEFSGLSTKQAMMLQAMMLHVRMTTIAARHVTTIAARHATQASGFQGEKSTSSSKSYENLSF
jgi:hypothetical protein